MIQSITFTKAPGRPSSLAAIRRSLLAGFVALVAISSLSGCGGPGMPGKLTQENLDKIQTDMSASDVKAILGEPTETKSEPIPIVGGTKTTYLYNTNNAQIVIVLKNDNVQTKEGHFGAAQ